MVIHGLHQGMNNSSHASSRGGRGGGSGHAAGRGEKNPIPRKELSLGEPFHLSLPTYMYHTPTPSGLCIGFSEEAGDPDHCGHYCILLKYIIYFYVNALWS